MSKETSEWLNGGNILVGFTEKRGKAWWYRADLESAEPTHYEGAIPPEDILRRLFHWKPVEGTVETSYVTDDGVTRITDPDRKTVIRPDTRTILGLFRNGYQIHDYEQWLVDNTELLLDSGELGYSSAGLLKGGAVAWVQVEFPETLEVAGVKFRPFLMATTSLDGSLASSYTRGSQLVVCDNTQSAALREKDRLQVKRKHSSKSLGSIPQIRDALEIMYTSADEIGQGILELTETKVSDAQWDAFLDAHLGKRPEDSNKASLTKYDNRRDAMQSLYDNDMRVAPWNGTAFGVLQAVSTFEHHLKGVNGMDRPQRNMEKMVEGEFAKLDQLVLNELNLVLAS